MTDCSFLSHVSWTQFNLMALVWTHRVPSSVVETFLFRWKLSTSTKQKDVIFTKTMLQILLFILTIKVLSFMSVFLSIEKPPLLIMLLLILSEVFTDLPWAIQESCWGVTAGRWQSLVALHHKAWVQHVFLFLKKMSRKKIN